MHELSLAHSVMKIVEREMERHPSRCLKSVQLTVGTRAGVELETFATAMRVVVMGSQWPEARVDIVTVGAEAECLSCGARFSPTGYITECPQCGSGMCGIVSGDEFRVSSIIIE